MLTLMKEKTNRKCQVVVIETALKKYQHSPNVPWEPKHDLTKKLLNRLENVFGISLVRVQQWFDEPGYCKVLATIRLYVPSWGQFTLVPANSEPEIQFQISTDGFGILVQRDSAPITALSNEANFVSAHLNNPLWQSYRIRRDEGRNTPI